MSEPIDLTAIKDKLDTSGSIFILFGQNATIDHVGSALGLYLALKEKGKDVLVASPSEMRVEFTYLVGLDKIGKSIGNRNLVISFKDYTTGSIERVSHNDDINNKFELTIQPKSGHKAPDPKNVDFYFTGSQADLIFVIGTQRLEDLGHLYEQDTAVFRSATTVSINRRQPVSFSTINVIDTGASSLAEITAELIEKLDLTLPADAASNLLAGIDFATNRFQNPVVSSAAFSMAGKLLKAGGKRQPQRISSSPTFAPTRLGAPFSLSPTMARDTNSFARALAAAQPPQFIPPASFPTPQPLPDQLSGSAVSGQSLTGEPDQSAPNELGAAAQLPPDPSTPLPAQVSGSSPAVTSGSVASQEDLAGGSEPRNLGAAQVISDPAIQSQAQQLNPADQPAPTDWTQPKIYKGSTRV